MGFNFEILLFQDSEFIYIIFFISIFIDIYILSLVTYEIEGLFDKGTYILYNI